MRFKESDDKNTKLVIVGGKGWKSETFYEAYNRHRYKLDILLLGFVPQSDLPFLYSQAAAFIYPSVYEGFGFPVLEAMACGCPVIVSKNSSLIEVGGDAVKYFETSSAESLFDAMAEVFAKPESERTEMITKGITQAAKFSWKRFGEELSVELKALTTKN